MKLIGSAIIFTICLRIAASIRCYECTSSNNSMCLDPTIYDKETVKNFLRSTDCEQGVFSARHKDFFCRKIVQTILHKNHDSEVRVTRGCGWVRHHRDCYKADNEDHLETVCQCFNDDCNRGGTLDSLSPMLIPFSILVLRF
ncbi:uncharacterized protein LOC131848927 [Achroia grisella]|uniref:uncharacterized protein LOC131848927 n=1 Tax=Achroia grisella TaxID=688607 RepID=UPI0027D3397B|nr:uncharacterized protein LOC131848927 [Achroia grisella]